MSAYWISHVTVTDDAAYGRYAKLAGAPIAAHGGSFLVRGGAHETLEGKDRARHVVVRFDSLQAAQDCYHSAAYQEALRHAEGASERDLVIVEGL